MDESEWRIELAADSSEPEDRIVHRILGNATAYRRWASEHDFLLRTISGQGRLEGQVRALRSAAMNLVHRKSLYQYVKERQLTGPKRRRLFELFYGYRDYTNAVLAEHGNYVRCTSSLVCAEYLAEHLMHDAAIVDPMALYEERYAEYFRAFCDGELAETEEERVAAEPLDALRPLLKFQLAEARTAILSLPLAPAREWREVEIRRPTGQTQKIRALDASKLPR
ncbi:MAG: hypothetical protein JSS29_17945 [Proteobacteria bacterium]|nr:hypothetical protein [Pseudomonadota bacterium]